MNPLILFFILGAATAQIERGLLPVTYEGTVGVNQGTVLGIGKEGLILKSVEVPAVEKVVGVQNVEVTGASQVGSGVGLVGRTEIPVVGLGQGSEGVVGTQTQYTVGKTIPETFGSTGQIVKSGIAPVSGIVSGVEYPVVRSGVEYQVKKIPAYRQIEYGYKPIFKAFPYLYQNYPVHQTVQYPSLEQDIYRHIPLYQKLTQLLRAFPYLYNTEYPVQSEIVKTGLQYPIYTSEHTGVRDVQKTETVAPVLREVQVGKYEPYVNKFYGKHNPIYSPFPYSQEYPTQKNYVHEKFPVTHSYSQDYFNTRFLDQYSQEYPVYKHEYPVYKHEYPFYKHEYPVYKHEYPVYKHEYPAYKHEYPVYQHEYPVYKHEYPVYKHEYPVYKHEYPVYKHEYPVYKHEYPIYKHEYPIYENNHVYKKYPQVYEPIEQREELPLNYDYEVPFRTGYPVDEKVSTVY